MVFVRCRARPCCVLRQQGRARCARYQQCQRTPRLGRNRRQVETTGGGEFAPRTGVGAPVCLGNAQFHDAASEGELGAGVADRHRRLRPKQRRLCAPSPRLEARELELHGQIVARLIDERVHAAGERLEDALCVRMVAGPLAVIPRTTVLQQSRKAIVGDNQGPEDFRQLPAPRPPVHVHLPKPILRLDEALGEEEILEVLRVDVRHPQRSRMIRTESRNPMIVCRPSIRASDARAIDSNDSWRVTAPAISAAPMPIEMMRTAGVTGIRECLAWAG